MTTHPARSKFLANPPPWDDGHGELDIAMREHKQSLVHAVLRPRQDPEEFAELARHYGAGEGEVSEFDNDDEQQERTT